METVGRYRLVKTLGAGAFATVWLGHDDVLELPVAVKVLADNWSRNTDIRERFLNEARLMRRISSPRVVSVHDVGIVENRPYSVMDYIPGGTVAEAMRGGLSVTEALQLALDSAEAVEALHQEGVLHRDLKPSNLMLRRGVPDPFVVVTDLGTAKLAAEASQITMAAGTPAYMAPELVHGVDGFDQRADVYALGVLTHELLTSRKPLEVRSIDEVVSRQATPTVVVAGPLGLPPAVDELLRRTLSVDREQRPATAMQFGEELLAAVQGAEVVDDDLTQVIHSPEQLSTQLPSTAAVSPPSGVSQMGAPAGAGAAGATVAPDRTGPPASQTQRFTSPSSATRALPEDRAPGAYAAAPEPERPADHSTQHTQPPARPSGGWPLWLVVPLALLLFGLAAILGWFLV